MWIDFLYKNERKILQNLEKSIKKELNMSLNMKWFDRFYLLQIPISNFHNPKDYGRLKIHNKILIEFKYIF